MFLVQVIKRHNLGELTRFSLYSTLYITRTSTVVTQQQAGMSHLFNPAMIAQSQEGLVHHEELLPYTIDEIPYHHTNLMLKWQRFRDRYELRALFLEFFGSFLFCFLSVMPLGGYVLAASTVSYALVMICIALGVAFSVYVALPHSGGMLTPSMVLCSCIFRGFSWRKFPLYVIAQFCGALFSAVLGYALFDPILDTLDGGDRNKIPATAAIFVGVPEPYIPNGHLFLAELVCDAIFTIVLCGIIDKRNPTINIQAAPMLVGVAVFTFISAFGWYGLVLNPFKDFAARVYISAYYDGLWTYHDHYAMIALFTPLLAHIVGFLFYDIFVSSRYSSKATGLDDGSKTVVIAMHNR